MTKLEKYKKEFEEFQKNAPEKDINVLQTKLLFELISAMQVVAKQNQENTKKLGVLEQKFDEIIGQPVEFFIEEKDDTDIGKDE